MGEKRESFLVFLVCFICTRIFRETRSSAKENTCAWDNARPLVQNETVTVTVRGLTTSGAFRMASLSRSLPDSRASRPLRSDKVAEAAVAEHGYSRGVAEIRSRCTPEHSAPGVHRREGAGLMVHRPLCPRMRRRGRLQSTRRRGEEYQTWCRQNPPQ